MAFFLLASHYRCCESKVLAILPPQLWHFRRELIFYFPPRQHYRCTFSNSSCTSVSWWS
jgi:hypothetical protein